MHGDLNLDEIKNALHSLPVNRETNLMNLIRPQLDSKDSSRNLHANCAIGFLFCPHLILHACVQTFDVTFLAKIFWI